METIKAKKDMKKGNREEMLKSTYKLTNDDEYM